MGNVNIELHIDYTNAVNRLHNKHIFNSWEHPIHHLMSYFRNQYIDYAVLRLKWEGKSRCSNSSILLVLHGQTKDKRIPLIII